MPITPIDLQTLFAQMNQVGKEQNIIKEGAAIQASLQNMQLIQDNKQKDDMVNKTEELSESIKNEENEKGNQNQKRKEEKQRKKTENSKAIFKDPNLGQHIDIIS